MPRFTQPQDSGQPRMRAARRAGSSRRAMVLSPDHQEAPTLRAPQRPRPRPGHPRLGRDLERQPPTLHLAQERRGDPRPTRRLLPLPQQI